jgi:hypothetical protein
MRSSNTHGQLVLAFRGGGARISARPRAPGAYETMEGRPIGRAVADVNTSHH